MSCKIVLLCLVGFVALAVAVPVENKVEDVKLEAVVAKQEKVEAPLEETEDVEEKMEDLDENEMDEVDNDEDQARKEELEDLKRGPANSPTRGQSGRRIRRPVRRLVWHRVYYTPRVLKIVEKAYKRYLIHVKYCYRKCTILRGRRRCLRSSRRCHLGFLHHVIRIKA